MEGPDLALLLPSWQLHLRAERKSAETLKSQPQLPRSRRGGLSAAVEQVSDERVRPLAW
ncbi:hypothetical protein [Nocardia farcinica]|uniref:hypothetical protein n=1 Tax=Nocardia farcinica TaxID=37329 RepID=UPI001892DE7E|nr:hypothetical protein [Nocardia farcinica]MBF6266696.1 hypothetical protein [Nocardia farcinica]MCZ9324982.1 hypothetical protein [Nocardia farcinica]